jgi:hypothetical protein
MLKILWKVPIAAALIMLPLIARADEDENIPLSPQQLSAQRTVLGAIAALVVVGIGFYLFRRWQTLRSGNTVDGGYKDD